MTPTMLSPELRTKLGITGAAKFEEVIKGLINDAAPPTSSLQVGLLNLNYDKYSTEQLLRNILANGFLKIAKTSMIRVTGQAISAQADSFLQMRVLEVVDALIADNADYPTNRESAKKLGACVSMLTDEKIADVVDLFVDEVMGEAYEFFKLEETIEGSDTGLSPEAILNGSIEDDGDPDLDDWYDDEDEQALPPASGNFTADTYRIRDSISDVTMSMRDSIKNSLPLRKDLAVSLARYRAQENLLKGDSNFSKVFDFKLTQAVVLSDGDIEIANIIESVNSSLIINKLAAFFNK